MRSKKRVVFGTSVFAAIALLMVATAPLIGQFTDIARHIAWGTSDPSTCNPNTGDIFFNTTTVTPKYCSALNTWTAIGGGTTRTWASVYSGVCQSGVASFPFSTPNANTPTANCVNSGTVVTAVDQWANNTSNQSVQQQLVVPAGFVSGSNVTVTVYFRSTDTTHNTVANLFYAVVANGSTIDNPTFTSVTGVNMMGGGSNTRTVGTITFALTANAGDRLNWKLIADTSLLTGGATWDLISIQFNLTGSV